MSMLWSTPNEVLGPSQIVAMIKSKTVVRWESRSWNLILQSDRHNKKVRCQLEWELSRQKQILEEKKTKVKQMAEKETIPNSGMMGENGLKVWVKLFIAIMLIYHHYLCFIDSLEL